MSSVKLRIHPQKTRIVDMNQVGHSFEFLGYHFERNKTGCIRRWPKAANMKKFKDKVRYITSRNNPHRIEIVCEQLHIYFKGWFQYFKHSMHYKFQSLDGFTRRRMRRILRKRRNKKSTGKNLTDHKYGRIPGLSLTYVSLYSMYEAEFQSLRS